MKIGDFVQYKHPVRVTAFNKMFDGLTGRIEYTYDGPGPACVVRFEEWGDDGIAVVLYESVLVLA